jgi:hypothetical protein
LLSALTPSSLASCGVSTRFRGVCIKPWPKATRGAASPANITGSAFCATFPRAEIVGLSCSVWARRAFSFSTAPGFDNPKCAVTKLSGKACERNASRPDVGGLRRFGRAAKFLGRGRTIPDRAFGAFQFLRGRRRIENASHLFSRRNPSMPVPFSYFPGRRIGALGASRW